MRKQSVKTLGEWFHQRSRSIQRATYQTLQREPSAVQEKRIQYLLRPHNYGAFFDYYFGHPQSNAHALGEVPSAPFHTNAYKELYAAKVITQFRLWYRGAAKSTHSCVGNPFALKCAHQLRFMLLVGINQWRARLLLADLQAQLDANERILRDFGKQRQYGEWKDGMFETRDRCFFLALGLNQPFRGLRRYAERVDLVVMDDIEDRKRANNPRIIQEYTDKITGDLGAIFHKDRQRMIIANNYILDHGILGSLRKRLKNNPYVSISQIALTDQNGKPTWAARYTKKDIALIHQKYDTKTLKSEYYNQPHTTEGMIKRTWIRFEYVSKRTPPNHLAGHWDLSYATKGDYKAFALVGQAHEQRFVVFDLFCRQCSLEEAMDWHYTRIRERPQSLQKALYYYEANASQRHVFEPIWKQKAHKHGATPPLPYWTPSKHKTARIEETLLPLFFHRQLIFDAALEETPDAECAIQQLTNFERAHARIGIGDDFPDALQAAVQHCKGRIQAHQSAYTPKGYIQQARTKHTGY